MLHKMVKNYFLVLVDDLELFEPLLLLLPLLLRVGVERVVDRELLLLRGVYDLVAGLLILLLLELLEREIDVDLRVEDLLGTE